jgi:chloramphenicol O-acetyltransferase type A
MANYLDLEHWDRRGVFEFFRDFDKPYFNICAQVDASGLVSFVRDRPDASVSLAYHYFALRLANEIEPFRYRMRNGKVLIHDVIHGGTTVLLPNEVFTLVYFDYARDFETFMRDGLQAIAAAKSGDGSFRDRAYDDARVHFTTIPWVSFTSFSHARNWKREDSVPKIAFGKFTKVNERTLLPISIEVHHALVDGLHVGKFLLQFEEALTNPQSFIQ